MNTPTEANKIDNLKESILNFLAKYPHELFKSKELSRRIGIRSNKDEQTFKIALRDLQDEQKILRVRGKKYGHLRKIEILQGKLHITSRGYGILTTDNGVEISIPKNSLNNADEGDIVEISMLPMPKSNKIKNVKPEAEVVKILKKNDTSYIGTLEKYKKRYFVVPNNKYFSKEIIIENNNLNGAKAGDKVVVKIVERSKDKSPSIGKVAEVLGQAGEFSAELQSVIREYNLIQQFPPSVLNELKQIEIEIPQTEILRRKDFRTKTCFTIDPEDAKDFDDAISIEKLSDGNYLLGVHIADVSYYIKDGSFLDKEALKRGTSVYFPNNVIPMLPEKISNHLCSLRPNEDKLCYSVFIKISPLGIVQNYEICETIINSKQRFSYERVQNIFDRIDNGNDISPNDLPFLSDLINMRLLSNALTKKRLKDGSIDFDSAEAKFEFDKDGNPTKIIKKVRLESHRLVEEFMLLANKIVAKHIGLAKKEDNPKPFIYRIHDSPDPEKINELAMFVKKFGYKINTDSGVTSKALQNLLSQVKGTEVENVINEIALRSMAKAIYSEKNIGHYGLNFDYYSHFTSPIRRYPDLFIHRLLKMYQANINHQEIKKIKSRIPYIAKQSSEMERTAMEAERTAVKVLQIEYMKQHLGGEFKAVIAGVTKFGLFVEISEFLVQGLVHVKDMNDDYYIYDEKQYAMVGRHKNNIYRLGDTVNIKVVRVNPEARQLDFMFVD